MSDDHIPPKNRHEFKIAILCALPLEASVLQGLFDTHWDAEKYGKEQVDTNAYSLGVLGPHNVVLVHMPNMGKVATAVAAAHLRASFRGIQLALVVGICGGAPFGLSGELFLGDIVISEGLIQYDLGRRLPNTFVRKDTPGENLPRPGPEVRGILAKLQTNQGRCKLQNKMLEHLWLLRQRSGLTIPYPGLMNDRTDGDDFCCSAMEANCEMLGCGDLDTRTRTRLLQASIEPQPIVHFGLVATGDTVMRSGKDRDSIAARDKVIAFEMKGAGVWETFPAVLVIKGVCDYADSHKNKSWQIYAAATAAAAAKAFLEHWNTKTTVCYFFFKDDFDDQKSITSALCCLMYQLFQQNPSLLTKAIVNEVEAGGGRFLASFSDLWHILHTAAQNVNAGEVIFILDAIDECENCGRSQLAKELCKLYGPASSFNIKLKFLVTSRPFSYIRRGFQPLQMPGMPTIHLSGESDEEMKKISAEIDIYIRARVEDIGERLKLNRSERYTLLEQLVRVPNRTYLWVYLILDLIESDINIDRAGILQVTANTPKTVDEAYNRILSKSHDLKEAIRILQIVVASERACH
ncbi:uncharacterized protein Triagg1_2157 [Trichoderma aggressivum f. europaeum]|uniref:Nucleoside phosphorylase domain-containing protein n=1 Tax=Trichoderma aggressivum f. europaeum TaxID=173218 RepID=A0AAE1IIG6_9HYPO|nr:hypothetical protein Triagg1_2157 [Trichoderma aggressivum f. europaeum]